jgi:hypothetical protein
MAELRKSVHAYNDEGKYSLYTVADVQKIALPSPVGNASNREELNWFINEIKKAFRGCEIRPDQEDNARDTVYHVYYPEDEYTMGWIDVGFCHTNEKMVYSVYSRDITNNKHSNYSSEFRTKITALQGQAKKNAKKYLRRCTHSDVVLASRTKCRSALMRAVDNTEDKHSTAWTQLFGARWDKTNEDRCTPILNEMYMLLDSGHEFLDKTVPDNLTSLRVAKGVKDQSKADAEMPMYAVRVYERLGKQAFDVCSVGDMHNMHGTRLLEFDTYYDDLPDGVLGKLSTLSICGVGDYIPQVGYRHSEALFYVTQ